MNVLLLVDRMDAGGVETHIFCLARELCKMGERVVVVSAGGRLSEKLPKIGVKHIDISVDKTSPLSLLRGRRALCDIITSEGIELIHAHTRMSAFLVRPLSERYGIPLVVTAHARFAVSSMYRRLSRWGDITVAVSEDISEYLTLNYSVDRENIRVIPNGIDRVVFHPDGAARRTNRIAFMSRLDRDCSYGALLLCDIAERLYRSFESMEIVIMGGGDMYETVKHKADRVCERVGERFIFLRGHVEDTAVELRAAAVFVGVSRASLEALGCGALTVLCGNEGGLGLLDSEERLALAERTNFCCREEKRLDGEELYREIERALSLTDGMSVKLSELGVNYVLSKHGSVGMATRTRLVYEEARNLRARRGSVVLCGYYGYGNMGDNALLRASIRRVGAVYPNREIVAMTAGGRRDSSTFGVRCKKRMNPISLVRALWNAEAVVFGGGTLLQDRTSLRSLVYYVSLCGLARLRGVRVELWGNGLVPPQSRIAAKLTTYVLESASYIGLRDMPSVTEALRVVSPRCADRIYLEEDLARRQRAAADERIEYLQRRLGLLTDKSLADYAIVAVKGSEGGGFLRILEGQIRELVSEGLFPVFLPMFPMEDRAECRRLSELFGGVVAEGVTESDTVGLMRSAKIVCGMRLHALVFAAAADVPFVGVGGDPKIEGFCRENGGLFFTDVM